MTIKTHLGQYAFGFAITIGIGATAFAGLETPIGKSISNKMGHQIYLSCAREEAAVCLDYQFVLKTGSELQGIGPIMPSRRVLESKKAMLEDVEGNFTIPMDSVAIPPTPQKLDVETTVWRIFFDPIACFNRNREKLMPHSLLPVGCMKQVFYPVNSSFRAALTPFSLGKLAHDNGIPEGLWGPGSVVDAVHGNVVAFTGHPILAVITANWGGQYQSAAEALYGSQISLPENQGRGLFNAITTGHTNNTRMVTDQKWSNSFFKLLKTEIQSNLRPIYLDEASVRK